MKMIYFFSDSQTMYGTPIVKLSTRNVYHSQRGNANKWLTVRHTCAWYTGCSKRV